MTQTTVNAVEKIIRDKDGEDGEDWATNKALAEELDIDKAAASRRARIAIGRGYLKNLEEHGEAPSKRPAPPPTRPSLSIFRPESRLSPLVKRPGQKEGEDHERESQRYRPRSI